MKKGSVYKQSDISWRIKYDLGKDPVSGKRRVVVKTVRGTKADAYAELNRCLLSMHEGSHIDPTKITVKEWLNLWLTTIAKPKVQPKTYERYYELLNHHVVCHIGNTKLQRLEATELTFLYNKLRTEGRRSLKKATDKVEPPRGLSEQTILHVHRVLSSALKNAVKQKLRGTNPANDAEVPKPKRRKRNLENGVLQEQRSKALSPEKLSELVKGFRGHDLFYIVTLAAGTGLRRGEVLALRWKDINFADGKLSVAQSVEETRLGLAEGDDGLEIKEPKNESSIRTISISEKLCSLLKEHRRIQAESALQIGIRFQDGDLIFPNSVIDPRKPMRPLYVTRRFSEKAAKLGFKGFTFHCLRHSHATWMLSAENPLPLHVVSARLGHSDPKITLSVYGWVLPRGDEKSNTIVDLLLNAVIG